MADHDRTHAASEQEARDVAEDARETEWEHSSFVKELFLGRFRFDLVHPHPVEDPASEAEDEFSRRIRPVVRDDAALNLEAGRLMIAEDQLARALEWMPEDPESHLLLGRLRQAQAEVETDPALAAERLAEAESALREAIRLDADRPEPHRELGLLLYRAGDRPAACIAFRHYLELAPEGDDAGRFRDYVLELERDGDC